MWWYEGCSTDLIHGVQEPLRVWGKALCQLSYPLHHLCLGDLVIGCAQIIHHLVHNHLQNTNALLHWPCTAELPRTLRATFTDELAVKLCAHLSHAHRYESVQVMYQIYFIRAQKKGSPFTVL